MRGKVPLNDFKFLAMRITTAHAGKSFIHFYITSANQDHPRPCGEKCTCTLCVSTSVGSPPPMRGKVLRDFSFISSFRITPAHAGKSDVIASGKRVVGDHPRPCGEKQPVAVRHSNCAGSPPPMRGKARLLHLPLSFPRITPAHAGKSICPRHEAIRQKDHPRPCGEKKISELRNDLTTGSPPPMRGKAVNSAADHIARRITPAHAGKSFARRFERAARGDHPRPCGEKPTPFGVGWRRAGSPPPMRGKVFQAILALLGARITPAHAGKSGGGLWGNRQSEDHPRPCGEKLARKALVKPY